MRNSQPPTFTPPPWTIDASTKPDDNYTWIYGPDGKPIAGTSGRIRIADACLIVAAHRLYAGCELALNAFENNWAINWGELDEHLRAARGEGK